MRWLIFTADFFGSGGCVGEGVSGEVQQGVKICPECGHHHHRGCVRGKITGGWKLS